MDVHSCLTFSPKVGRIITMASDPKPQVAKKKKNVLTKALKVFAKEGFRNTDVQVIADLAGVGKGTVYRYFGNKEQLFLATAKFSVEQLGAFVEKALKINGNLPELTAEFGAIEMLRRIARACAEFYQKHPQAVEMIIQERAEFRESVFPTHLMFRAENRSGLDQLMRDGIKRGELRDIDVETATNAFSDLIHGSVINGCLEGGKGKLVERVESAMDFLIRGMVASASDDSCRDTFSD